MKKISIVLILLLALTFTLVACQNPDATVIATRWKDGETYTFNITLADFEESQKIGNATYKKEILLNGETDLKTKDEIIPVDVLGTFTMSIKVENTKDESDCTFTTTQTLYSQYRTEYLSKLSIWEQLQPLVVATDAAENPFKNHEGLTTLKSTRNTEVVFVNTAKQQPKSSKQDVDGFYLGKEHQEITKSTVVTKYEFTKKKLNVNVSVDGKATDYKLNYNANVNVIDANQALLYVRSLEKTTTSFQDSPQVKVFDPFSHTLLNGSFSFTYGANTLLDYSGAENAICATLNSVAFVVDGSVYLMQINLPDNVKDKDNKMLDVIKTASTSYAKYTTVRFRSGALSYELAEYDELKCGDEVVGAQIIEAIKK